MKLIEVTKEDIKNMTLSAVTEIINRQRNIKNAQNVFVKNKSGYNGITHFGVITAENPDSEQASASDNKKYQYLLAKSLKSAHYIWVWQKEHFGGNDEHSMFVFNISVDALAYYSGKYQQTSFIYGELRENCVHSEYWEKQDSTQPYHPKFNPYVKKDECDEWIDASNEEDYSVIGKRFKYTIPFSIFSDLSESIINNLNTLNENDRRGALNIGLNGIGSNGWRYRGLLYKGINLTDE